MPILFFMCIVLTPLLAILGDIVALGDGRVGGNVQDFNLEVGQTVVYSKFGIGSTDLDIQGQRHTMLREDDCIGIMPRSGATASDIPELRPVGDRVLLKVSTSAATAVETASVHVHTSVLCLKSTK
jgi:co-chaperonin GroES (HSP10)